MPNHSTLRSVNGSLPPNSFLGFLIEPPPLNLGNGSLIHLPCADGIDKHTNDHQPDKKHACPIEIACTDIVRIGPETPEKTPRCVHQSGHINWQSQPSQTPTCQGKGLAEEAPESDTAY